MSTTTMVNITSIMNTLENGKGWVLAGGRSSATGRDKAGMVWKGEALAEFVAQVNGARKNKLGRKFDFGGVTLVLETDFFDSMKRQKENGIGKI